MSCHRNRSSALESPAMHAHLCTILMAAAIATPMVAQDQAQKLWQQMSLEQRVGQLFMVWTLASEKGQEQQRARLLEQVRQGLVGGVIVSKGTMPEAQRLIAKLQAEAQYPLLIAADLETGLDQRLTDAPHLGSAMLLGATGQSRLAFQMGQTTAIQARDLGYHLNFAPVVDVNCNPDNPIINLRSFGEDPQLVARMGVAMIRGLLCHRALVKAAQVCGHLGHIPQEIGIAESHHQGPRVTEYHG